MAIITETNTLYIHTRYLERNYTMADTITLNVTNPNNTTRKFSIMAENETLINSIVTVKNNTISYSDMEKLQNIAKRNGDAGVLEQCDFGAEEKLALAKLNKFGEYYDITLSNDKKYFKVKIKDAGMFCANPNLATIKSDFGIKDNVLVQKGGIPHGNEGVITGSHGGNFDGVTMNPGEVINIPVEEININGTPSGGFSRFLSRLTN